MTTIYCLDTAPLRILLDYVLTSGTPMDRAEARDAFLHLAAALVQAEEHARLDAEWRARQDAEPAQESVEVVVDVPAPPAQDKPAPHNVPDLTPEPGQGSEVALDRDALKRECASLEAGLSREEIDAIRDACKMRRGGLASLRTRADALDRYRRALLAAVGLRTGLIVKAPTPPQETPEPEAEPEAVQEPEEAQDAVSGSPWMEEDDLPAATALPNPAELF